MKLLIVEDEQALRSSLKKYLEELGYICEMAGDLQQGVKKIEFNSYDCIVVDVGLPGGNGLEIVKELKEMDSPSGIIVISAKDSLDDKLAGLQCGSDDYLVKPFHLSELSARINAIIRRKCFNGSSSLSFHEIILDTDQRIVLIDKKNIELTDKEYKLLLYFLVNKKRVITKSAIADHIWGNDYEQAGNFDFIYTHIKNLRKKLTDAGSRDYIKTVYGTGYRFTDN